MNLMITEVHNRPIPTIGFLLCPCEDGQPIMQVVYIFGPISLLCYVFAEYINGPHAPERIHAPGSRKRDAAAAAAPVLVAH